MKTIQLLYLHLERFKGIADLTLDFNGKSCTIEGDNAAGKTTVYDAYLWLLTGKDSLGRSDFEIMPLDKQGHVVDHAAVTAVEAVLSVDGEEVTLRREYYERWTKPRGRAETVFDGHTTDYYRNGVPKSKKEYEAALGEIVPMDILRLLSDTTAFAKLKWQERRSVLFQLAGIGSDLELMQECSCFAPLVTALGKDSLDEYRARCKAQRRKINSRLTEIPVQIAENRKIEATFGEYDFEAIAAELEELEEEERRISTAMAQTGATAKAEAQNRYDSIRLKLDDLDLKNRQYRSEQKAARPSNAEAERKRDSLQREISALERRFGKEADRLHSVQLTADAHRETAVKYRQLWTEENARTWTGGLCPTCGQPLPAQQEAEAKAAWLAEKQRRLDQISATGRDAVEHGKAMDRAAEEIRESMVELENTIAQRKDELAAVERSIVPLDDAPIEDMPGYENLHQGLTLKLHAAQIELDSIEQSDRERMDGLRKKRFSCREQSNLLRSQLAKQDALAELRSRIQALEDERHELAGVLDEIDHMTDLADEFIQYRSKRTTESVNCLFDLAEFRMFSEQVNGETPPACDILCHGVPYDNGLNTGARINVGLDIIRTLGMFYKYRVPVFVDNAEAVTEMERMPTQVIRLAVSDKEKELVLNEN